MSLLLSSTSLLRPSIPAWLEDTCQKLVDNAPTFRVVDLTHPRIDDVKAKIFANALEENHVVNTVILSCFNIVDDGAYAISSVLGKSHTIKKLQLKDLRNSREIITFFQLLQQNDTLTEVALRHCRICPQGAVVLSEFLSKHPRIQEVRLTDTQFVNGASLKLVCEGLKKNTSLQRAYFVNNELSGAESAVELAHMLQGSALRELYLGENELGDEGVAVLAQAILHCNTSLRFLDLRSNGITAAGAMSLQGLVFSSQYLLGINLSNNELGSLGAKALARGLQHSSCLLQKLDLSFNQVDEAGSQAFATMLRTNKNLQDLNLSFNSIGDHGAKQIVSALQRNVTLRLLSLKRNGITNIGAQAVASKLPNLHGLKELLLSKNLIDHDGMSALLEGLRENVEIEHLNVEDSKLSEPIAREIHHWTRLNMAGRRILRKANTVPAPLWSHFYSRVSSDKDTLFYFLTEKPETLLLLKGGQATSVSPAPVDEAETPSPARKKRKEEVFK